MKNVGDRRGEHASSKSEEKIYIYKKTNMSDDPVPLALSLFPLHCYSQITNAIPEERKKKNKKQKSHN